MKVVVGISWNELTVRVLRFTTEFDSAETEASHCLTCQTINFCVRCRCLKIFLASERWPASSPVGAALATATSRRQLWGLKALHILKKCNSREPMYFFANADLKVGCVRFQMSERHLHSPLMPQICAEISCLLKCKRTKNSWRSETKLISMQL